MRDAALRRRQVNRTQPSARRVVRAPKMWYREQIDVEEICLVGAHYHTSQGNSGVYLGGPQIAGYFAVYGGNALPLHTP